MTFTRDIYRRATEIVTQHGDDAPEQARQKVNAFLSIGNVSSARVWLKIMKAAEELLRQESADGER